MFTQSFITVDRNAFEWYTMEYDTRHLYFLGMYTILFTPREHCTTIFYHAIENTMINTINATYAGSMIGRLGVIRPNIIWLVQRAGKMNQIVRCDWLHERARWAILPSREYPLYPARKFPRKPYSKSFIDQACSVKMAGYWPCSFFPIMAFKIDKDCFSSSKQSSVCVEHFTEDSLEQNNVIR